MGRHGDHSLACYRIGEAQSSQRLPPFELSGTVRALAKNLRKLCTRSTRPAGCSGARSAPTSATPSPPRPAATPSPRWPENRRHHRPQCGPRGQREPAGCPLQPPGTRSSPATVRVRPRVQSLPVWPPLARVHVCGCVRARARACERVTCPSLPPSDQSRLSESGSGASTCRSAASASCPSARGRRGSRSGSGGPPRRGRPAGSADASTRRRRRHLAALTPGLGQRVQEPLHVGLLVSSERFAAPKVAFACSAIQR
jgi:hypothetical protein